MTRLDFAARALLLEVVVTLAIMVAAMGLLGAQLVGGLQMVAFADQQARTAELSDRILALLELDQNLSEKLITDNTLDGDFGPQYPGFFWQVNIEPTDIEGLGLVHLRVLRQEDPRATTADGASVVAELHLLKAAPKAIDLQTDFGFSDDQLAQLSESVPIAGLTDGQLDVPKLIKTLTEDPAAMIELLPQLLQVFAQIAGGAGIAVPDGEGGGPPSVDQIRELMQANMQGGPGGGQDSGVGQLLELRDRMFGAPGSGGPGGINNRGGGNRGGGTRGPGGAPGGIGNGTRGGANPGAGNRGGGQNTGGNNRGGGQNAGGNNNGGQPRNSLEDLMRIRDELARQQGQGGPR